MRRVVGPVVLVLASALLVGCSARTDSSSGDDGGVRSEQSSQLAGGAVDSGAKDGDAVVGAAAIADRQIVTSGTVEIVVARPGVAAQRASELVEAAGGRVDERVEQAASSDRTPRAHLVVRIPAAKLTATLEELKDLGVVERVELTATDVTDKAQDLDARITALTVSVGRLEALMGSAISSADLLALESALSARQSDLESMTAQRAGLAGQVSLATITLELVPRPTVVAGGPDGFWSGIVTGWGTLLATLKGATTAIGVLLPWLVFLGVLGAAATAVVRFARTRRRTVTLGSPVAATGPDLAGPTP